MKQTPVLHFHGKFRFHMPEYNNNPRNETVPFDPQLPKTDVMNLCGCDPARYYEFEFADVKVTQVTYGDGTQAATGDAVIGQSVRMAGLMPDISASAICAQLFAARLRLGEALRGEVDTAVQSDLRLNVRPEGFGDETAAAHFDAAVTVVDQDDLAGSRWSDELKGRDLELHFQLNRYTRLDNEEFPSGARLMGDVYGYLRPRAGDAVEKGRRVRGRRLVAHPRLGENPSVEATFLLETGGTPLIRITDIDGFYDLLADDELLTLRYLDFIPFLDREYTTPEVDRYDVYFEGPQGHVPVGQFTGRHDEMVRDGGLLVFPLPAGVADADGVRLAVDVVKDGEFVQPLMIEAELDLVLESSRGLVMASGETVEVTARVFRDNQPVSGHPVRVGTQRANGRSPVVARIAGGTLTTDKKGHVTATVRALDLKNTGGVADPVTGQTLSTLPMDRYYGNYVFLEIDQPLRRTTPPVEQIELATRVVHRIAPGDIPATPSFEQHIRPLFTYYVRYFPWLHTVEAGGTYVQFLDVSDHASVSSLATTMLNRLELEPNEQGRMPRSRDFPAGGVELLRQWIDSGMQA